MKKTFSLVIIMALTISLVNCGGDSKKEEEAEAQGKALGSALGALAKMGKEMEKNATATNSKMAERRAKGDTLAMPYTDLQKYLPVIDGFKMGEPDGGSVNMTGMSYSSAEGKYTSGTKWIKVTIVDYNQAYSMYAAATAMWAMGMNIDTPTEKANGFKIDDKTGGWEVFQKKNKQATVTMGVGERFWVNVEANEQEGTDLVKGIAKSIDLAKLAAM